MLRSWVWLFVKLTVYAVTLITVEKCLFVVSICSNTNSSYHNNFCVFNTECSILWCSSIIWKWMLSFVKKTLSSQYSASYWDIRWGKLWICCAYHQGLSFYKDRWAEDDEYWFFVSCNWLKESVFRFVNLYLFVILKKKLESYLKLSILVTFEQTMTTQIFYIPKTLLVCFYKADKELILTLWLLTTYIWVVPHL